MHHFFAANLLLRVPALPSTLAWSPKQLLEWAQLPASQEALALSSPTLADSLASWLARPEADPETGQQLVKTLYKYATRMSNRCTPFGLAAGCTLAGWVDSPHAGVVVNGFRRRTRLDTLVVLLLTEYANTHPELLLHMRCYLNPTCHLTGQEASYIEYIRDGETWVNQISLTELTEPLDLLNTYLTDQTASLHELSQLLTDQLGYTQSDAITYLTELLEGQILLPETTLRPTGSAPLSTLVQAISKVPKSQLSRQLLTLQTTLLDMGQLLLQLDKQAGDPTQQQSTYAAFDALLQKLPIGPLPKQVLQVDSEPLVQGGITQASQKALLEGVDVLKRLSTPSNQSALDAFKIRFYERYEEQEVPLLQVLDDENGIGYNDDLVKSYSSLTSDLITPASLIHPQQILRQSADRYLYTKWLNALQENAHEIRLHPDELVTIEPVIKRMPVSMSLLFRQVIDGQLYIENSTGISSLVMMGRFTDYIPRVCDFARQVAQSDAEQHEGAILAEIVHMPEDIRAGNITLRRPIHAHEIPIFGQATSSPLNTIHLTDLLISVRQGVIRLRSKRLDKVILPRLSTAHNFRQSTNPIYRFLADLQYQNEQAVLQIDWQRIEPEGNYFPRLVYQDIILKRATWYLHAADLAQCRGLKASATFQAWWRKRHYPDQFVIVAGDNELLIDITNELAIQVLQDEIKSSSTLCLEEWLAPDATAVTTPAGETMANQWVATLYTRDQPTPNYQLPARVQSLDERTFLPGSEWLYVKFYGGVRTQDQLLTTLIWPLVQELLQAGMISKWFFVRYADPHPHVRVRLLLTQPAHFTSLLADLHTRVKEFQTSGGAVTMQLDTYVRELERYALGTMDDTEWLFFQNSQICLQALSALPFESEERWLYLLPVIDRLLDRAGLSVGDRVKLAEAGFEAFSREFNVDLAMRKLLNQKYRVFREAIQACMTTQATFFSMAPIEEALTRLASQYGSPDQQHYLHHHIHMAINRMLPDEQRLYELILYFFLKQWYTSQAARERTSQNAGKTVVSRMAKMT